MVKNAVFLRWHLGHFATPKNAYFAINADLLNWRNSRNFLKLEATICKRLATLATDRICPKNLICRTDIPPNDSIDGRKLQSGQSAASSLWRWDITISFQMISAVLARSSAIYELTSLLRVHLECREIGITNAKNSVRAPSNSWTASTDDATTNQLTTQALRSLCNAVVANGFSVPPGASIKMRLWVGSNCIVDWTVKLSAKAPKDIALITSLNTCFWLGLNFAIDTVANAPRHEN